MKVNAFSNLTARRRFVTRAGLWDSSVFGVFQGYSGLWGADWRVQTFDTAPGQL